LLGVEDALYADAVRRERDELLRVLAKWR